MFHDISLPRLVTDHAWMHNMLARTRSNTDSSGFLNETESPIFETRFRTKAVFDIRNTLP